MNNVLVSAVITTHNRSDFLIKAIESVLTQTYKNIECIVVDDASSDDTSSVASRYEKEGKIRYIRIEPKDSKGGNHARNIGIHNSNGEYIAFLDDDDRWLPFKIEKQLERMEETGCDICHCATNRVDEYGNYLPTADLNSLLEGDLSRIVLYNIVCGTSTFVVKKSLIEEIGGFDETIRFWQEYDLCIRLFQDNKVAVVRDYLVDYLVNVHDTKRLTNNIRAWEEMIPQYEKKFANLFDRLTPDEEKRRQILIIMDGMNRCKLVHQPLLYSKYLWKKFLVTHNLKDAIKALLLWGYN